MKTSTILKIAKATSAVISKCLIACAEAKEKKGNKALDASDYHVKAAKDSLQSARKLKVEADWLRAAAKSLGA